MPSPLQTSFAPSRFLREQGFLIGIALVVVVLMLFDPSAGKWLSLDRPAVGEGQWWRLLTGHLVHLGPYHAMLNLIGLGIYLLLCPQALALREWIRRWLFLSLATGLALQFWAGDVERYFGLSGVIHGLFLLGLWPQARRRDPVAVACLIYLLGKLVWEQWAGAPVSDELAIGGPVVTRAHLFGTLAAAGYAILFGSIRTGDRQT